MDVKIRRNQTEKDHKINQIIDHEWAMFDRVRNEGGRASCQDDAETFYIMRYSQFVAFPVKVLDSYYNDILMAELEGRNLLMEKYGYMMERTDPEYFENVLRKALPEITPQKNAVVDGITSILTEQEIAYLKANPEMAAKSRPVIESIGGWTSSRDYLEGELKTYSFQTLTQLLQHLAEPKKPGEPDMVEQIHATTLSFY